MGKTLGAALLSATLLAYGVLRLEQERRGLTIRESSVGAMPVTVFQRTLPAPQAAGPVVVVTHGFAGSQQLMQPLALTLAASGYTAVTFDLPGHGRNAAPMSGGMADPERSMNTLLTAIDAASQWASRMAPAGAGVAMVAHSMSSDLVVQYAQSHPEVWATVALASSAPGIDDRSPPDRPRNLLVIEGEFETRLHGAALRALGRSGGPGARPDVTYGRFEDGSARRAVFARGVEHIGVLYSAQAASETISWLDQAAGASAAPALAIASYGAPLGLVLIGVLGLGWSLARVLPRGAAAPAGWPAPSPVAWRQFWPLVALPALLTPLLLWPVRSDFLPILLGDYLALHFGLYGLITGLLVWRRAAARLPRARLPALAAATAAWVLFDLLAIGLPVNRYLFNLALIPERGLMLPAIAAGTLCWFLADETLTRGAQAPRAAYFASKFAFLLSLIIAIALDPRHLFFLALIVPAILLLFLIYGLFSRWSMRCIGHPAPAAVANALAFAWFIAAIFPLVR
jgi:pimeloyl-ACP methyl ester carboxylesterase